MTDMTTAYIVTLEGNDLDVKKVQKLNTGDELVLKRLNDAEDTYEICVCFPDGREIDMLSYAESIGIAPFMDSGLLTVEKAEVTAVRVTPGKTHATDVTRLYFKVKYSYDEEVLSQWLPRLLQAVIPMWLWAVHILISIQWICLWNMAGCMKCMTVILKKTQHTISMPTHSSMKILQNVKLWQKFTIRTMKRKSLK